MGVADITRTSAGGGVQNVLTAQADGWVLPRLSTTQRLALSLTTSDAGLQVFDFTSATIYLWNGTAWVAPSVTYTQGIWTPTFSPTTGSITLVPASSAGLWSRIGNTVTIVGYFKVQSINSPTGVLTLTNLPFPVVAGFEGAACISAGGLNNGARTAIAGTIMGTGVQVYHYDSGSLLGMGVHVLAGSDWYVSGTYITS
jgi:hypothetical protein